MDNIKMKKLLMKNMYAIKYVRRKITHQIQLFNM